MSFFKPFRKKILSPEIKESGLNTYMISDLIFAFAIPITGIILYREKISNFFVKIFGKKEQPQNQEMNAELFKNSISNKIKNLKEGKEK